MAQVSFSFNVHRIAAWTSFVSCLGILLVLTAWLLTVSVAPSVNVQWRPKLPPPVRELLQQRYHLAPISPINDDGWEYDLVDTSRQNVAALLADPYLAAAEYLDATHAKPADNAPPGASTTWIGDRLTGQFRPLPLTIILLILGFIAGLSLVVLVRSGHNAGWYRQGESTEGGRLTKLGVMRIFRPAIPVVDARVLGFYRIVFASLLAFALVDLQLPTEPFPREMHQAGSWLADWGWVHWLASRPELVGALESGILAALFVFALGLWARVAYGLVVVGLIVWTLVRLQHTGTHPWAVALLTVVCLIGARWGDGFGWDAMIRRWRGRERENLPSNAYGFPMWLPGLVVGTAFAGAAIAKLRGAGLEWITSGAVKYHFVIDARQAPVDWGLWVASHHGAAVLLSAMAILIEGGVVLSIFVRPWRGQLPFALAGFGLLTGFWLFQSEFWVAWWVLMICFFVPWPALFETIRLRIPRHIALIDGACPRCRATARLWHGLDWFDRLEFVDLTDESARQAQAPGIPESRLVSDMHVICGSGNHVRTGYEAYVHLARSVPILWPASILAALPPIRTIGDRLYRRIAGSRERHLCTDRTCARSGEAPIIEVTSPASLSTKSSIRGSRLTLGQAIPIAIVCGLQAVASVGRLEVQPVLSDYPMYSNTYASIRAFRQLQPLKPVHRFYSQSQQGRLDVTARLDRLYLIDDVREPLTALAMGKALSAEAKARVAAAAALFDTEYGTPLNTLILAIDEEDFDWKQGRFYWKRQDVDIAALDTTMLVSGKGPADPAEDAGRNGPGSR